MELFQFSFEDEKPLQDDFCGILLPFADSKLYFTKVTTVQTLTKGFDVKSVYDIGINVKHVRHDYVPGDTIGIFPQNNPDEVDEIINCLNISDIANMNYNLTVNPNVPKKKNIPSHIPTNGTIRNLFLQRLDIRSIPKKAFLRELAKSASSETEQEELQVLCAPKAIDEYNNFISGTGKSLSGILKKFPSVHPPLSTILEYLPALRPRIYSLITSPLSNSDEIRFAVSVLDDPDKGVCSGWLERNVINNGTKLLELEIPFFYRKSNTFKLPLDPTVPIILVGPGTGVAPFIGFLRHRNIQKMNDASLGDAWLFFGCRYSDRDFLYEDELKSFVKSKVLTNLVTSFSRESSEKVYVQNNIIKHARALVTLLTEKNAFVYVCGDAKSMRKDVKNAFVQIVSEQTKTSLEECEILVNAWQKNNKYIEDIWL